MPFWLERDTCGHSTLSAVHFARGAGVFTFTFNAREYPAVGTLLGLVGQSFILKIFLLSDGKQKAGTAFSAI